MNLGRTNSDQGKCKDWEGIAQWVIGRCSFH